MLLLEGGGGYDSKWYDSHSQYRNQRIAHSVPNVKRWGLAAACVIRPRRDEWQDRGKPGGGEPKARPGYSQRTVKLQDVVLPLLSVAFAVTV